MSEWSLIPWRQSGLPFLRAALELRDRILYEDEEDTLFRRDTLAGYVAVLILNGGGAKPKRDRSLSNDVIGEIMQLWFEGVQKGEWKGFEKNGMPDESQLWVAMLELYWFYHSEAQELATGTKRPRNVPWPAWDAEKIEKWKTSRPANDPGKIEFYESLLGTGEITGLFHREEATGKPPLVVDENFDVHSWKDSQDSQICAICARLLCKTTDGKIPERQQLEEACEALKKLFQDLPRKVNPDHLQEILPHRRISLYKVYILFLFHLGRKEEVKQALGLASSSEEFGLHSLIDLPELYELLAEHQKETGQPLILLMTEENLDTTSTILIEALKRRITDGRQKPFENISWDELLQRFAEAVFITQKEEYSKLDEPPQTPKDILLPPMTATEIEAAEIELGPIPEDIKEMSRIARGFKGGWMFAGGGFAGIDQCFRESWKDHEVYIPELQPTKIVVKRSDPFGRRTETGELRMANMLVYPEGLDFGQFYCSAAPVESDNFLHVIVPVDTWKKIKQGQVKYEGEYRYFHFANWTGGERGTSSSVREWIEDMAVDAENQIAREEYLDTQSQSLKRQ